MNGTNVSLLDDCRRELNGISRWIGSNAMHSNVRFLVSYAVIKSCGSIEHVLKSMLHEYLSQGASCETDLYLQKKILEASFNPGPSKIEQLFESMSSSWKTQFKNRTASSSEKIKLKSLVTLRNDFAHGSPITVSISEVIDYFDSGRKILEWIDEIMYPPST